MIISTRELKLITKGRELKIMVRLFAPKRDRTAWSCRYEIDWPDGLRAVEARGVDSMQALILALQMIGAELYTSNFHKSGELAWTEPSRGYGFPITRNLRDLLVGDDAKYL